MLATHGTKAQKTTIIIFELRTNIILAFQTGNITADFELGDILNYPLLS
jgi:hypothetical protein